MANSQCSLYISTQNGISLNPTNTPEAPALCQGGQDVTASSQEVNGWASALQRYPTPNTHKHTPGLPELQITFLL